MASRDVFFTPAPFSAQNLTPTKIVTLTFVTKQQIIPSQMEVAPLYCTVDVTQKRRLFKNTKETEKI